jgi:hypothetical protein
MRRALALLIGVVCVYLASCTNWRDEMPADKHLQEVFVKNGSEFESLLKMMQADAGYQWIDVSHTYPEKPPLPGERWKDYRTAFARLGLSHGVERKPFKPGITFFNAAASGNPSGGKTKGYAHSATALPTVASLDAIDPKKRTTDFYFMKLDGEWYLFLNID